MAIDIRVFQEEVTVNVFELPQRLRQILIKKMEGIFAQLDEDLFLSKRGQYLDPKQLKSGVEVQGSQVIGYLEYNPKPGFYSILPQKKQFLINLQQKFFAREVHLHPYPDASPVVEQLLHDKRAWIIAQLNSVAEDI